MHTGRPRFVPLKRLATRGLISMSSGGLGKWCSAPGMIVHRVWMSGRGGAGPTGTAPPCLLDDTIQYEIDPLYVTVSDVLLLMT